MRVVIDTNVLVSGLINPHAPPGRIVDAVLAGHLRIFYDDRILGEYREVLLRPFFGFQDEDIDTLLNFIEFAGERASAIHTGLQLPDPTDLPFLEVAMAGTADALITGNIKHFKPKRGECNVRVCSPAEFLGRTI